MIMMTLLLNRNMLAKSTMDFIKLSTHIFPRGMRENDLESCEIRRLNGTSTRTRSTYSQKTLEKHKHLQEG
jgi:hypothetical protein